MIELKFCANREHRSLFAQNKGIFYIGEIAIVNPLMAYFTIDFLDLPFPNFNPPPSFVTSSDAFDGLTKKRIDIWCGDDFDQVTRDEIRRLLRDDPKLLADMFEKRLDFGTGGMRGLMGVGTNRMNIHTVGFATQGLIHFLKKKFGDLELAVIISCDTRRKSEQFLRHTAQIFAGNGIKVHLLEGFYPIPLLSFGCRYFKCQAAVMITASHNRAEYNGFKVYGEDGSQVVAPDDQSIIDQVALIDHPRDVTIAPWGNAKIIRQSDQMIAAYFAAIDQINPDATLTSQAKSKQQLCKVIYTPLHGAGASATPRALRNWGFEDLMLVSEQMLPDGDFPTVSAPNPEDPLAMALGVNMLLEQRADLLIANDPDSDRMGAVVCKDQQPRYLTGNEVGALIFYHLCSTHSEQGSLPPCSALIKSWVTSDFLRAIADHFEIKTFEVPTGFKFIAAAIRRWNREDQHLHFLFGAEESLGYLTGDHARDKDGVLAACLLAQAAQKAKLANTTLLDHLEDLYRQFGIFCEKNFHIDVAANRAGRAQIAAIMEYLKSHPPQELAGLSIENGLQLTDESKVSGADRESDMIVWKLTAAAKLIIRPSGTEPKIKFYLFNHMPPSSHSDVATSMALAKDQLRLIEGQLRALIKTFISL